MDIDRIFVWVVGIFLALWLVAACYKCEGKDCDNLPPVYPDYLAKMKDAR